MIDIWCFNAIFSNISAISWRPVLVVEEAGMHGENHRPWASNWSDEMGSCVQLKVKIGISSTY
jgi:hypothetical protein